MVSVISIINKSLGTLYFLIVSSIKEKISHKVKSSLDRLNDTGTIEKPFSD